MKAQEVKRIRKRLRLTMVNFAAEIGVTFNTVWRWENGHYTPTLPAQRLMKELLDKAQRAA